MHVKIQHNSTQRITYVWMVTKSKFIQGHPVYPVKAFEFEIKEVNITVRNINHQE